MLSIFFFNLISISMTGSVYLLVFTDVYVPGTWMKGTLVFSKKCSVVCNVWKSLIHVRPMEILLLYRCYSLKHEKVHTVSCFSLCLIEFNRTVFLWYNVLLWASVGHTSTRPALRELLVWALYGPPSFWQNKQTTVPVKYADNGKVVNCL